MITGLSYALASITVTLLLGLASRQRHETRDNIDIYLYPSALLWALAALTPVPGVLGLFLYSTWTPSRKPTGFSLIALIAVAVGAMILFLCVYLYGRRYRVELSDRALTIKTWVSSRSIPLNAIVDVNVIDGRTSSGGNQQLVIYLGNNEKLRLPGTLTDFDDLAATLQSRLAPSPSVSTNGTTKQKDIETLARNKRRERWITYIGLGIVAIALLIAWKFA